MAHAVGALHHMPTGWARFARDNGLPIRKRRDDIQNIGFGRAQAFENAQGRFVRLDMGRAPAVVAHISRFGANSAAVKFNLG